MAKIINISDKLNMSKPSIVLDDKKYVINDGMDVVMKFEELASQGTISSMVEAMELSLGKEAVAELGVSSWSVGNFKVLTIAILAAMQDMEYDEAAARFQQAKPTP